MAKTTTTERYEVCSLCGGRGQEYCANTTSGTQTCRQCHGSGQHLVERTIVTTHGEELTAKDAAPSSPSVEQAITDVLNAANVPQPMPSRVRDAVDVLNNRLRADAPKASPSVERATATLKDVVLEWTSEPYDEFVAPAVHVLIAAVRAERNDALQSTIDRLTTINQRLEAEIKAVRAERAQGEGPATLAKQIIDAIPHALGITPDPWPASPGEDGEPHRTVASLIAPLFSPPSLVDREIAWRLERSAARKQGRPVSGDHDGEDESTRSSSEHHGRPNSQGDMLELRQAVPVEAVLSVSHDDQSRALDSSQGPSSEVATPPAGTRERIIAVADKQFNLHNEYDAGVSAIGLAAAREVLMILEERLAKRGVTSCDLDDLKAELTPSEDR